MAKKRMIRTYVLCWLKHGGGIEQYRAFEMDPEWTKLVGSGLLEVIRFQYLRPYRLNANGRWQSVPETRASNRYARE